jgi:phosphatidylinositol-bisphosphatase
MCLPGEDISINFTMHVNNELASALNSGREVLNDIIILRLENGRDYYISVSAAYGRSCFGMNIDELVLYEVPIRQVPLDPIKRFEKFGDDQSPKLCVPKELWRIVDALYQKGLRERDLFSVHGFAEEVHQIRECLDTGRQFDQFHVHSMAEVLISFLSSLSTPVVPANLIPSVEIDSQNLPSVARGFLDELPPSHYNVFMYMSSFFRECLLYRESNQLTVVKLARISCNCLVVGSSGQVDKRKEGMSILMRYFLESNI